MEVTASTPAAPASIDALSIALSPLRAVSQTETSRCPGSATPAHMSAQLRSIVRGQDARLLEPALVFFLDRTSITEVSTKALIDHPALVDVLCSSQEVTRLIIDGHVHAGDLLVTLEQWPPVRDDVPGRDKALFELYLATWTRMRTDGACAGLPGKARATLSTAREPYYTARKIHAFMADASLDARNIHARLDQIERKIDPRLSDGLTCAPGLIRVLDRMLQKKANTTAVRSLMGRDASPRRIDRALQLLNEPRFLAAALRHPDDAALSYAMLMSCAYSDHAIATVVAAPYADDDVIIDACFIEQALRQADALPDDHATTTINERFEILSDGVEGLKAMLQRDRLSLLVEPENLEQLAMFYTVHHDRAGGTTPFVYALGELSEGLPRSAGDATGEITSVEVLETLLPKPGGTPKSVTDWVCATLDQPRHQAAIEAYVDLLCHASNVSDTPFAAYIAQLFKERSMTWVAGSKEIPFSIEDRFVKDHVGGDDRFADRCRRKLCAAGLMSIYAQPLDHQFTRV